MTVPILAIVFWSICMFTLGMLAQLVLLWWCYHRIMSVPSKRREAARRLLDGGAQ